MFGMNVAGRVWFALALLAGGLAGCGGGGGGGGSTGTATEAVQQQVGGAIKLSGSVLADPDDPSAAGQNAGATVYLVGQQQNAVTTDANGNFVLSSDIKLSNLVVAKPPATEQGRASGADRVGVPTGTPYGLVVIGKDKQHGRKTEVWLHDGQATQLSPIYINTVGAISGTVRLQDAPNGDHTGIHVYIPGTSFSAMTSADGSFTVSGVPAGSYDFLRAEKDGYRYSTLSNIRVDSKATTTVTDQLLLLSTGATGTVMVADGTTATNSRTVGIHVAASDDAVLMMVSENAYFSNAAWQPLQSATTYTFASEGEKRVWIKFADANGLESPAYSSAPIFVDSNPLVAVSAPQPGAVIGATTPTFSWSPNPTLPAAAYRIQIAADSSFASPLVDEVVDAATYTLPASKKMAPHSAAYWRVAIVNGDQQWSWAGPWSYRVDLGTVATIMPLPYGITDSLPSFDWSDSTVAGARYRIQVARDTAFLDLVTDTPGLAASAFALASALEENRAYYWRVAVVDGNDVQGDWSVAQTFSVSMGNINLYGPSGITSASKPVLSWSGSALSGASYRVQLTQAVDSGFASPLLDAVVTTPTLIPGTALDGGSYHWRVAVIDGHGSQGGFSTPLSFSVDLGSVVLLAPAPGAFTAQTTSVFDWSDSPLPGVRYQLQLSTDAAFSQRLVDASGLAASTYTVGDGGEAALLDGAVYYWRVRVVDANGIAGAWSTSDKPFTISLGRVALFSPEHLARLADTLPVLDWSDSTALVNARYRVQVATDIGFTTLHEEAQTPPSTSTHALTTPLADATDYFWRVCVIDANGVAGEYSEPRSFRVDLGQVMPLAPVGVINNSTPVLDWSDSALAGASYRVQLALAGDFLAPLVDVTTAAGTSTYSLGAASKLAQGSNYEFRVAVINAHGVQGAWSAPAQFTLDIGAVTLQTPAQGGAVGTTAPLFDWSDHPLTGVAYRLQVAAQADFSSLHYEVGALAVSTHALPVAQLLADETAYYWRVAAVDANGVQGPWSSGGQFQVSIGSVEPLSPLLHSATNNRSPSFSWSANPNAAGYVLSLATSPDLAGATTYGGISGTTYTLLLPLPATPLTDYYWAVTPLDVNGVSGTRSPIFHFALDSVAPQSVSVLINDGGTTTANETVTLSLSATDPGGTGVAQMWVATDAGFSSGTWEAFAPTRELTLPAFASQNSGVMVAYAQFMDEVGNVSVVALDDIALARTLKSGPLAASEQWLASASPYVVQGTVTVLSGQTLTIDPGVEVRFASGTGIVVNGKLVARGLIDQPITFTSNRYEPAPGDWAYVHFTDSSDDGMLNISVGYEYLGGSVLQHCVVEYAGSAGFGAVRAEMASPWVDNCQIRNNAASGIYIDGHDEPSGLRLTNNIVHNNSGGQGGGIFAAAFSVERSVIRNSVVVQNRAAAGGGVYLQDQALVADTVIAGNTASNWGGGVEMTAYNGVNPNWASNLELQRAAVVGNRATEGSGIKVSGNSSYGVTDATVAGNSGGEALSLQWIIGTTTVSGTGLFNNGVATELRNLSGLDVTATGNYWGTTVEAEVPAKVFDVVDDITKGMVTYSPVLTTPNIAAPISPPTGVSATAGAGGEIVVTWNANPEADCVGYRVHWDIDTGYPYANAATVAGAASTTHTITGLVPGTAYFVTVTARDSLYDPVNDVADTIVDENLTQGHESWFAAEQFILAP